MGLFQAYQEEHGDDVLISGVTGSMLPAIATWLNESLGYINEPYAQAVHIKNKFRLDFEIPRTPPNNYLEMSDFKKLVSFLYILAVNDAEKFFIVMDYMFQKYGSLPHYAEGFEAILADAGHEFTVQQVTNRAEIVERLPKEEMDMMKPALNKDTVYSSEFRDAFTALYGTNPDPTKAAGEAFQAVESALKKFLGDNKGDNLGAIYGWLRDHRSGWQYNTPSNGQDDAEEHFLSLVNFMNKSYRKTKHGHADEKLTISKKHAEVILRCTALIIHELENTIELT